MNKTDSLNAALEASFSKKPKPNSPSFKKTNLIKGTKKTTVSFQEAEQKVVDRILDQLRDEGGIRGGFSDAIKIALRLCPNDPPKVLSAWNEARSTDGRVLRHKK